MNRLFRLGPVLRARKAQEDAARGAVIQSRAEIRDAEALVKRRQLDLVGAGRADRGHRAGHGRRAWSPASRWPPACSARSAWSPTPRRSSGEQMAALADAAKRRRAVEMMAERHAEMVRAHDLRVDQANLDELAVTAKARNAARGRRSDAGIGAGGMTLGVCGGPLPHPGAAGPARPHAGQPGRHHRRHRHQRRAPRVRLGAGRRHRRGGRALAAGGGATGADVVDAAKKYLGTPYVFGSTDPDKGLDCSALVQRAYADLGIKLPRLSSQQAKAGQSVAEPGRGPPGRHPGVRLAGRPRRHLPGRQQDDRGAQAGRPRQDPVGVREAHAHPPGRRPTPPRWPPDVAAQNAAALRPASLRGTGALGRRAVRATCSSRPAPSTASRRSCSPRSPRSSPATTRTRSARSAPGA